MEKKLKELERKIEYTFRDFELLRRSMRHSSYVNEKHMKKTECNERLEFLGDAVLELVSSEFLFFENQNMPEGELQLNDKSMYGVKGRIETIRGGVDRNTGTASLRAVFPNKNGVLYSDTS